MVPERLERPTLRFVVSGELRIGADFRSYPAVFVPFSKSHAPGHLRLLLLRLLAVGFQIEHRRGGALVA